MAYSDYEKDNCLSSLRGMGVQRINFWCVGTKCRHRIQIGLIELLRKHGGITTLRDLARMARCSHCGRKGVHVDVMWPPDATEPDLKIVQGGKAGELLAFPNIPKGRPSGAISAK